MLPNAASIGGINDPSALTVFLWVIGAFGGVLPRSKSRQEHSMKMSSRLWLQFLLAATIWAVASVGLGYAVAIALSADFSIVFVGFGSVLAIAGVLSELGFLIREIRMGPSSTPRWVLVAASAVIAPSLTVVTIAAITGDTSVLSSALAIVFVLFLPAGPISFLASRSYLVGSNSAAERDAATAPRPSL